MAKSTRRRNAKKTVGRKKRVTKGYRRKTMRKRQKGGVNGSGNASERKTAKYTIQEDGEVWRVTLYDDGKETTYTVPDNILKEVAAMPDDDELPSYESVIAKAVAASRRGSDSDEGIAHSNDSSPRGKRKAKSRSIDVPSGFGF